MILTIDLGTSFTKVALWGPELMACGRAELTIRRPTVGWAEQDPATWWESVQNATAAARDEAGLRAATGVSVVACCGARQTFAPVDAGGVAVGPGILWSDRRAIDESAALASRAGGGEAVGARTGSPLTAESVAAKLAWLRHHRPEQLQAARWILTPRDLLVWILCGEFRTDPTMASRSGLYDLDGELVAELAGHVADMLPPVVDSDTIVGSLAPGAAEALAVPPGVPVVIGAGDRACEVIGAGAGPRAPMASWGTTASVAVPVRDRPRLGPAGLVLSRSAADPRTGSGTAEGQGGDRVPASGWLLEGGLSAAGGLLDWLADLTGRPVSTLLAEARNSPPGARGVLAMPWLGGARAPWWRDGARAAFVGVSEAHDAGDFGRAAVESVALDLVRCLAAAAPAVAAAETGIEQGLRRFPGREDPGGRSPFQALVLAGRGSADALWPAVLAAASGLPVRTRRSGEAASAGAAWLGARATGQPLTVDELDPPLPALDPEEDLVTTYRRWRRRADSVAALLIDADFGPGAESDEPGLD